MGYDVGRLAKLEPRLSGRPARADSASNRRAAEQQGRDAEDKVARHWHEEGYQILARRLRTGCGEIDLVVADSSTLIFLEVKSRGSLLEAAYAVTSRQQARLLGAADQALAEHPTWQREDIRFDVALVSRGSVRHIPDAIRLS